MNKESMSADFWQKLDEMVITCTLTIDRPKGSAHPRYPNFLYPLDYGYLAGTRSGDGDGIDVWIGSLPERRVTAIICAVDLLKRDSEMKLLLGCAPQEAQQLLAIHNTGTQSAILIERPEPHCIACQAHSARLSTSSSTSAGTS
jgi:inorganic pyrophosphatase